jgi:predicted extracellular nuclease
VINGITIPEPASDPVTASCGTGALTVLQGATGSRTVTATDPDGTVVSLTITSPAVPGITIGATTPAGGVGGTASADVMVAGTTSPGTYQVEVTASNNDAEAQTGSCTLTVIVTPVRTIGEVQGPVSDTADGLTHRSPFAPASGNGNGQIVFVRGVVTQLGRFPTATGGQNWGFWLQSRVGSADGDATSSDGIFVFIGGFQTVLRLDGGPAYQPVVGDEILMRGTVVEFFNLTELGSPRLVEVSDTGVDVTDAAQVETTEAAPPDSLANANRFWERHEGMRFHLDAGAHVVAARDTFPSTKDGELWVIRGDHAINQRPDPYQRIVYRDPHPLDDLPALFDNGNGMRIMLQSHGLKGAANSNDPLIAPANTYDTVINEVAGSLYFAFNKYGIEITEQLELGAGVDPAANFAPQAVDPAAEFATSDYNVENLYDFRDDPFDGCDFVGNGGCPGVNPPFDFVPASEQAYEKHLTDLAAQIAGPMHAPDLLMIQEAEDQDICTVAASAMVCGTTNNRDGRPDTLQELALAITAAGGPTYVAAYDRDGADDRGIVSAFMYRTDTVELLPPDADDPVLGSSPTVDYRGTPLGYNSQVSNPKALNADLPSDVDLSTGVDGGNVFTRPPQVGHFRVWRDGIGLSVFTDLYAMSNHFSSTPNARVGQRTEQAAYNAAIVAALADAGADRVVSAGDFNVFPRPDDPFAPGQPYGDNDTGPSDQLGPMYAAGLHNLWDRLVAEVPRSAYSYSFDGQAQTLDMQWATDAQFADLVEVRAAHLNADFAADFDGDVARGASDHDPQVARWSTDATFARLHALVDYYVATGQLPANKAFLFHNRLDKAQAFAEQGKVGTARSQLKAFGNQAHGFASPAAADAMAREADRLAELL